MHVQILEPEFRIAATNHPFELATANSWALPGTGSRSSGSGESLTRVRLFNSRRERNYESPDKCKKTETICRERTSASLSEASVETL